MIGSRLIHIALRNWLSRHLSWKTPLKLGLVNHECVRTVRHENRAVGLLVLFKKVCSFTCFFLSFLKLVYLLTCLFMKHVFFLLPNIQLVMYISWYKKAQIARSVKITNPNIYSNHNKMLVVFVKCGIYAFQRAYDIRIEILSECRCKYI